MEIVWTEFATNSLKDIFDYHKSKVSLTVAKRIKNKILVSTKRLSNNPELGQEEFFLKDLNKKHRYLISGNYKIIYCLRDSVIIIEDIFDVRRNPNKMIANK